MFKRESFRSSKVRKVLRTAALATLIILAALIIAACIIVTVFNIQ